MALVSAAVIFKAIYYRNADSVRQLTGIIVASYVAMFTGIGGFVKPYFTDHSKYLDLEKNRMSFRHGTGSFVNPADVMTNAHVVKGCASLEVVAKSGRYPAKIIAILERRNGDIAFIRTEAKEKKFIILSRRDPKIGDIVLFPNYTSDPTNFDKARGKITLANRSGGLEFLAPHGRGGNSGSPIYNKKGYVVGILHSAYISLKPIMAASDAKTIADFALKNKIRMFYIRNEDEDLTQHDGFFEDFAVTVICFPKNIWL